MKLKIAHLIELGNDIYAEQSLKEHLTNVSLLCEQYMSRIGCPTVGYLTGLLHDLGKCSQLFQDYLERVRNGMPHKRGEVNHSSAGGIILNRLYNKEKNVYKLFTLQLISEAIFCHHGSLLDNVDEEGNDGYEKRLTIEQDINMNEIQNYLFCEIISLQELDEKFKKATNEIERLYGIIRKISVKPVDNNTRNMNAQNMAYTSGLVLKYLESCLIDSDWQDSFDAEIKFKDGNQDYIKEELVREKGREQLWKILLSRLEKKFINKLTDETSINYWRANISEGCKEASTRETGIYTLCCPTGAGKTLTSLRYALSHSIEKRKKRIFYIVPYLSILEQNALSACKALDLEKNKEIDKQEIVAELHSGHIKEEDERSNSGKGEFEEKIQNILSERMTAPIIFITMVRFLNTFFAGGTRNLRPAHQFQDAIIIFDEIQALPLRTIAMFNGLINFLSKICNCTCILCSATQPLLHETDKESNRPVFPLIFNAPMQLVNISSKAYEVFKRVNIVSLIKEREGERGYSPDELAELVITKAQEEGNALVIMNTKNSALKVYRKIVEKVSKEYKVIYLSTLLYPEHRKKVIRNIKDILEQKEKVIVVSTQLVEAGIDFSFKCVFRALAGMDSIIQAAGRCNRERGDSTKSVYIVNPNDDLENLSYLKDIKEGADCTRRLLHEFESNPIQFDKDLLSEKAMKRYFTLYFYRRHSEMFYLLGKDKSYTLYDLLSTNSIRLNYALRHKNYQPKAFNQSFGEAGKLFRSIDEIGQAVFVPKEDGKKILNMLNSDLKINQYNDWIRKAQKYVVNLTNHEIEILGKDRGILTYHDKLNMFVVNEMYYDNNTGLTGEVAEEVSLCQF